MPLKICFILCCLLSFVGLLVRSNGPFTLELWQACLPLIVFFTGIGLIYLGAFILHGLWILKGPHTVEEQDEDAQE